MSGIAGGLGATVSSDADGEQVSVAVVDLFGSVVLTVTGDSEAGQTVTPAPLVDEFGVPVEGEIASRYGWLGGKERTTALDSGIVLMGVRVYVPHTGRFVQTDPIIGGSASAYDYCNTDPINCHDLDGRIPLLLVPAAIWGVAALKALGVITVGAGAAYGLHRAGKAAGQAYGDSQRGKELAAQGAALLGRSHNPANKERWQQWYNNLSKKDKELYRKSNGPRPGKRQSTKKK